MESYPLGFYGVRKGDRSTDAALITRYQRFGFPYQFAFMSYPHRSDRF